MSIKLGVSGPVARCAGFAHGRHAPLTTSSAARVLQHAPALRKHAFRGRHGPPPCAAADGGGSSGSSGGSGSSGKGGSGGGGGGSSGGGKKPSGGAPHPMRPWTFAYAAFVAVGGTMGYLKAQSSKSLLAGMSAAIILLVCALQMGGGPATGSAAIVAAVVAAALTGVMGMRYSKSGKFMPAGLAATVSGGMMLAFLLQGF